MMAETVLEWTRSGSPGGTYFIDGTELGEGDHGFDAALDRLRRLPRGRAVLVRYPMRLSTGGRPFEDTLPFRDRIDEFRRVVAENGLRVRYSIEP